MLALNPLTFLTVFAVIFVAELPDKSLFASLVLGTRYRAAHVWVGVAGAFAVHVLIAVTFGGLVGLLPHRVVEVGVAMLFLVGALMLLLGSEDEEIAEGVEEAAAARVVPSFRRVALTSFGVVFVGEWGDITQIATLNYAAKYDPLTVGVAATLALWAVAGLAVTAGSRVLAYVPVVWVRRATGVILLAFAVTSAVAAIRG